VDVAIDLILASSSPRRQSLLARLGLPFVVRPVDIDEDASGSANPRIVAARLARTKAEAARLRDGDNPIIVAADTVVALGGRMLGKPDGADEARQTLSQLRGRTHDVVTAVAIMPSGQRSPLVRNPVTRVSMRLYSEAEVQSTISRGDPFDKAGGYAIQDEVLMPVESYEGCYCNVMGLPLWSTAELLRRAGVPVMPQSERLLPQCASCPLRPDTQPSAEAYERTHLKER
jgi:MAF protein